MNKVLTLVLLASLLPQAAFADDETESADTCILVDRILYVDKLDARQVLVKLRGGKQYVLGVEEHCRGLENAVQYTIRGATNRACPDRLSRIAFREKSRNSDECRIETITEVSDDAPTDDDEAESD